MKFKYLNELAEIAVDIDEGKNISDVDIFNITERGFGLIANMKLLGLDVGALQEIFAGMQLMCDNCVVLTELIDMAHEEIEMLLGDDAWRIYGCAEGGWFYAEAEAFNRMVA